MLHIRPWHTQGQSQYHFGRKKRYQPVPVIFFYQINEQISNKSPAMISYWIEKWQKHWTPNLSLLIFFACRKDGTLHIAAKTGVNFVTGTLTVCARLLLFIVLRGRVPSLIHGRLAAINRMAHTPSQARMHTQKHTCTNTHTQTN